MRLEIGSANLKQKGGSMHIVLLKIIVALALWLLITLAVVLITGMMKIFFAATTAFQKIKVFWKT
ncbi:MAG: hypothetical protein GXP44_00520 [bacterium]|nr:hypothetical protein [bacterium]